MVFFKAATAFLSLQGGSHRVTNPTATTVTKSSSRLLTAMSATRGFEEKKAELVFTLLEAKKKAGVTFDEIAKKTGYTNAYVAQLFYRQATLSPGAVDKLKAAVPTLTDQDIAAMQEIPWRSYDRELLLVDPFTYRLDEAILHYAQGIKAIVNEKLGDGIVSAIDMYMSVDFRKGKAGENRVITTFDGKFLPHVEQLSENAPKLTGLSDR